jgi:hypothetical protein
MSASHRRSPRLRLAARRRPAAVYGLAAVGSSTFSTRHRHGRPVSVASRFALGSPLLENVMSSALLTAVGPLCIVWNRAEASEHESKETGTDLPKAKLRQGNDFDFHNSSSRPGWTDNLFRLSKRRVSKVPGRRVLCKRGNSVLFISRECVGAAVGHKTCSDARAQRRALDTAFRFLCDYLLLRFYPKAQNSGR